MDETPPCPNCGLTLERDPNIFVPLYTCSNCGKQFRETVGGICIKVTMYPPLEPVNLQTTPYQAQFCFNLEPI